MQPSAVNRFHRLRAPVWLALTLVAGGAASLPAQTEISTKDAATGRGSFSSATPGYMSIGQSFRVPNPTDVFLHSFEVAAAGAPGSTFHARLFEFDESANRLVNGALYDSGELPTPDYVALPYSRFDLGAVQLAADRVYMFFTTFWSTSNRTRLSTGASNPYGNGSIYTLRGDYLTKSWSSAFPSEDVGFSAVFSSSPSGPVSVVPEPVSMLLLGTGLVGVGAAARRRPREEDPVA